MIDLTSVTNAVNSTDAAVIMRGYVDALRQPDSEDRKTILAHLLAKLPMSSGNLTLAERIANNTYCRFARGSPDEEAAADAYLGLFRPAKASGNLELAAQIASNAYLWSFEGGQEKKEALEAVVEIRSLLATTKTSALAGSQRASSEVTLSQIAKTIRQILAPQTPGTASMETP